MKSLFYRLSTGRSFAKLFSVLPVLVLFAGTASAYLATYPSSGTNFLLSGPPTICEFFRPDLKHVQVNVDSSLFGGQGSGTAPVTLSGTAVCGILDTDGVLRDLAHFDVNDLTFGCVTQTFSGNTIKYAQYFSDLNTNTKCPDGSEPVSGSFTGRADLPVVGNIDRMLTYCSGGVPEVTPGLLQDCLLIVGIPAGVNKNFFEKKTCPKDPSTGRTVDGQIFAFEEKLANGEFRPGTVDACYCHSDLDGGAVTCGQGSTGEPIETNTAAANPCIFDWQKTGTEAGDTINISGSPSQVNGAIYDGPLCPVRDIDTRTVRVCNDVTPRKFKIGTDQGKLALTFQINEGDCRESLQGLVTGEIRLIYAIGELTDGTHIVGADDVVVVTNP